MKKILLALCLSMFGCISSAKNVSNPVNQNYIIHPGVGSNDVVFVISGSEALNLDDMKNFEIHRINTFCWERFYLSPQVLNVDISSIDVPSYDKINTMTIRFVCNK
jgi:hypothetical protein